MNDTRVCRFYLRGHCKHGDNCRMSHGPIPNGQVQPPFHQNGPPIRHRGPRPQLDPRFTYVASHSANNHQSAHNPSTQAPFSSGGTQQVTQASQMDPSKMKELIEWIKPSFPDADKALDLLKLIRKEAQLWLKSGDFWRFTSRSFFPGGQLLNGWNDYSFEEIKWAHRTFTSQNEEHKYKQSYTQYWEQTERHLFALSKLDLETLKELKPYLDECLANNRSPLIADRIMTDTTNAATSNTTRASQVQSNSYTPDDQLLPGERAAFESDTFEIGQIPTHAPSRQFS